MRILMVTPYLPYPPASGGQIRTFNILKHLSKKNEIILVSLYKKDDEKKYISYLKPFCREIYLCKRPENPWQFKNIMRSIFSLKPFLIVRNFSQEAEDKIKEILSKEKIDVIHCETFYVMPHIPKTRIPILLVEQTIEYKVYQHFVNSLFFLLRPFFYPDILKLNYWERHYWKKATTVATVSFADERLIRSLEKNISPEIIPNGAGDDMFIYPLPKKNIGRPIVLFVGNFFWLQNQEAANFLINKIYPRLVEKISKVRVMIAGQEADKVRSGNQKGIEIVNIEPDDISMVKEVYQKATIFIAPILGPGGTRLKILAAFASGLPVVGTRVGLEGLNVKDKKHVLYADDVNTFVDKVYLLTKKKKLYEKLQKNAYDRVKKTYSWDSISKRLERVYKKIQKKS